MKSTIALLFLLPSFALAGTTLTVDGTATTQPSHWTTDELKHQPAMPTTQISYTAHDGSAHHATCVSLLDVLNAAGVSSEIKMNPKADPRTKHRSLRLTVSAKASDGYGVVFSFAELMPDIGHRAVWLALDEDDKDLAERDTPTKLIVPDDAKPARWVHGVEHLSVDDTSSR